MPPHSRMLKKAAFLTRPTLAGRDSPFPKQAAASDGPKAYPLGARCDESGAPSLCAPPSGEAAWSPLRI